jgi:hypothetical protein
VEKFQQEWPKLYLLLYLIWSKEVNSGISKPLQTEQEFYSSNINRYIIIAIYPSIIKFSRTNLLNTCILLEEINFIRAPDFFLLSKQKHLFT